MSDIRAPVPARWTYSTLAVIGLDGVLIAMSVTLDIHILSQPQSWQYSGEPVGLLTMYAAIIHYNVNAG